MLDSSIPEHSRYISQTTTGSLLLILGFAKVPLIEDVFANFYGLNETNSILYKNGSFFSSMIEAIKLTPKKYIHKQQNLNNYTLKLRKLSVQNIRTQILICSKRPRILVLFEDHYQLFLARLDFLLQRLSSFFYTLSVRISSKFKK